MSVCVISQLQEYFKSSLPHSGVSDSLDLVNILVLYFPKKLLLQLQLNILICLEWVML